MQESYKVTSATQNTQFKVGQTVWCLLYGKGKVVEIVPGDDYPIMVAFGGEDDVISYTADGKYYSYANRTLFFSEPEVIAATEPVFEPKLVGKVVIVYFQGVPAHVGEVTTEDSEKVVTQDYGWLKCSYTFHEVNPQPITFD